MWTLFRPLGQMIGRLPSRRGEDRRSQLTRRRRMQLETLEPRNLLSAGGEPPAAMLSLSRPAEVRAGSWVDSERLAAHPLVAHSRKIEAAKKASFTIAQVKRFLPGQWYVQYDASSLFGPGAVGAQQITFTGPKGSPTFISTTGVKVQGFFGPAYYQFSSWGTYRFLSKKLVRLTITGASPTEYLNNGIIVMGGQFMPIQFLNKNQFIVQGQTYNRVPLQT
jgi:hypothetical protein